MNNSRVDPLSSVPCPPAGFFESELSIKERYSDVASSTANAARAMLCEPRDGEVDDRRHRHQVRHRSAHALVRSSPAWAIAAPTWSKSSAS